jgi:GT2 family glycosyltransferase
LKLVVIIATAGRAELVGQLLRHLETQTRPPDEVVLAAPDASHLDPYHPQRFAVSRVFGRLGLTAQRNLALELALSHSDVIIFFDDDFLPADDYLERVEQAFTANPQWSVLFGHAVHDGARTSGLTFREGLLKLRAAEAARSPQHPPRAYDHLGAYGCNMSVRSRHVGSIRFDERLVLYGWQEDIDFTNQLRRCGRVIALSTLLGVHLGAKAGRVSGLRFGYSQVVNPIYLIRKGTMPATFAIQLMTRNLAANLLRSLWPEAHVDRVGRLKGNLLAAYHLLKGKVEPEHVLKL